MRARIALRNVVSLFRSFTTFSNAPPPITTKMMIPNVHVDTGLFFASFSCLEACVGFFPERAAAANFAFRWRISNSVGWMGNQEEFKGVQSCSLP